MAKICRRFPNFNLNETGNRDELYSQNRRHHHHTNHHNPTGAMAPMYGMAQLAPASVTMMQQPPIRQPVQQQFQQQQFQQQQPPMFAATNNDPVDYSTNTLNMNPLNMGGFQMDQRQQYYDPGNDAGYFQQTPHFGQGTCPGL